MKNPNEKNKLLFFYSNSLVLVVVLGTVQEISVTVAEIVIAEWDKFSILCHDVYATVLNTFLFV